MHVSCWGTNSMQRKENEMPQDKVETDPQSHRDLSSDAAGDPTSTGVMTKVGPVIAAQPGAEASNSADPEGAAEVEADAEIAAETTTSVSEPLVAEPAAEQPAFDETSTWQPSGVSNSQKLVASEDAPRPSARREREDGPEPAAALTSDRLLTTRETPPVSGWRRVLYSASFGYINVGDSDKVRLQRARAHRISMRLGQRTRYVPVLSRKGGVGKTTVTTLLGMALADMREDRVIAMDANPDRGTLSDRSPGRADFTARHLVKNRFDVTSFSQLAAYVARDG
ncbi:ATPases involved in chromosome partitioning [Renibacterium salmoninarum ATCC 33209]|uniref:ATPases involved in chromosome partitioning n=2 Tax=Renibacterium salmoninarum TaxID=1646 RepID=A9WRG5_RENSM|nr:ATPases involved in chromosome partitioning [Renibacterium salmoninarum ATCC 33209]